MPTATIIHGDARHLPLADCSVDAVVCDPPYELGFMGRRWDSTGVAYDVATWREAMRVLKPGGHLLAFGGSRTWHRLACAIEDAGFELRDSLAWMYGSGFPKSLDVSKAIDKRGGANIGWFGPWLRQERMRRGLSSNDLGKHFPSKTGGPTGCVRNWELGLNLPTVDQFNKLCEVLDLPFARIQEAQRQVLATRRDSGGRTVQIVGHEDTRDYDVTAPATDDARRWQGFGTALKPSFEPVVVARRPLQGTVAANVLQWGCGALNVDGCRVGDGADRVSGGAAGASTSAHVAMGGGWHGGALARPTGGRWPTNVVFSHVGLTDVDGDIIGDACDPVCVPQCPVAELDAQSGVSSSRAASRGERHGAIYGNGNGPTGPDTVRGHDDTGSASRFFPVFRYQAKAPARERPKVNGVSHPTVKPLTLMKWLARLTCPPGGTILDMFAGSGATLEAALLEGFNAIGVERSAEYLPLIQQRIDRATAATQPAVDDVAELTLFDVA